MHLLRFTFTLTLSRLQFTIYLWIVCPLVCFVHWLSICTPAFLCYMYCPMPNMCQIYGTSIRPVARCRRNATRLHTWRPPGTLQKISKTQSCKSPAGTTARLILNRFSICTIVCSGGWGFYLFTNKCINKGFVFCHYNSH